MQAILRSVVKGFLSTHKGATFIGYQLIDNGPYVRPCFITRPGQSESLVWNRFCYHNLVRYIRDFEGGPGKIGLLLKGCDARAVRELIRMGQIQRERLFLVGIQCEGLSPPEGSGLLYRRCLECRHAEGFQYDVVIGELKPLKLKGQPPVRGPISWQGELERCLLCGSCRHACYRCFCRRCIFDLDVDGWVPHCGGTREKYFYHIIRAFHCADTCIGCGECQRACPAGIRLAELMSEIGKDLRDLGFEGAGVMEGIKPALTDFSPEDPSEGLIYNVG